jgi:hypothetical protein
VYAALSYALQEAEVLETVGCKLLIEDYNDARFLQASSLAYTAATELQQLWIYTLRSYRMRASCRLLWIQLSYSLHTFFIEPSYGLRRAFIEFLIEF